MSNPTTLIISDTTPGFVRTKDAEALARFGEQLEFRMANHLGGTLKRIAEALLRGEAVTIDYAPAETPQT